MMLLETILIAVIVWSIYIAPILVAVHRGSPNVASIATINILLGWTFIAWVICLAWAFKRERPTAHLVTGIIGGQPYASVIVPEWEGDSLPPMQFDDVARRWHRPTSGGR